MPETNIEELSMLMCMLLDLKRNETRCSPNPDYYDSCVQCEIIGEYFNKDESIQDTAFVGHIICTVLWLFAFTIGISGVFTNILVIAVLRKRKTKTVHTQRNFNFLVMTLACFDIVCCVGAVLSSTFLVIFANNWIEREKMDLHWHFIAFLVELFGRSTSMFLTVLIVAERYVIIAFPTRSKLWFTPRTTKVLTAVAILFPIALNVPRITYFHVRDNPYGPQGANIEGMQHSKQLISLTSWFDFWQRHLHGLELSVDYLLPFPLLLLFNGLTFYELWKYSRRRAELSASRIKEINSAKIFLPVILVLLICNIAPVTHFLITVRSDISIREMYMLTTLSLAITSSSNFLIYYYRGSSFREETTALLSILTGKPQKFGTVRTNVNAGNSTSRGSTR